MKKNKRQLNATGFTLVEMLIAVLIFSISLVALMSISSKGLKSARNSEKQIIADYLALEAVEVVHNLRDAVLLRSGFDTSSWELVFQGSPEIINGDEGCFDGLKPCNFYSNSFGEPVLGVCGDCTVFIDEDKFYYFQTHNDVDNAYKKTAYRREIFIKSSSTLGQVVVIVTVFWGNQKVVYSENLYLWQ